MPWRPEPGHERLGYGLAALLGAMFLAVLVVAVLTLSGGGSDGGSAVAADAPKGPGFVTVRTGDSYGEIAAEADLTVDELIALNPRVNPSTLQPGQELKLRADARRPKAKVRKGPVFWTVEAGDTLDLISRRSGKSVIYLKELNKGLQADALQPGDRIRLRRTPSARR